MFRDEADREGLTVKGAIVHGAQSRYFVLDARRDVHTIGVHFRPGGGTAMLGLPAGELGHRHFALEDIWGARAGELREQLLEAREPRIMFAVLEREFLRRLRQPLIVHPAISFALRQFDAAARPDSTVPMRVASVQQATGYSDRRFITLFTHAVGLPPKLYSRVQRLHRVVKQIAHGRCDLAQVAADNGYYDQSHLNRDFREFAGVTPGNYRPMPQRSALHMEAGEQARE